MPNAAQSGMKNFPYVSHFSYGDRVRLTGLDGHLKKGEPCTIIYVLPNPSKKPEHQWYDVRFEDGSIGRFLERYIAGKASEHQQIPREIPLNEWSLFFDTFTGQHENWLVRLQTFNPANAQQLSTESLRLKSISANLADSLSPLIVIAGESESSDVTHVVRKPSRVVVTQSETGADEGVDILSENLHVVIRFRAVILPELVNGMVA
jgi:hypothetical protein